jgi:hypothetical protein
MEVRMYLMYLDKEMTEWEKQVEAKNLMISLMQGLKRYGFQTEKSGSWIDPDETFMVTWTPDLLSVTLVEGDARYEVPYMYDLKADTVLVYEPGPWVNRTVLLTQS